MWEDNQNPNAVRNFSLYKIRFLKSSSKRSKSTGGEGQGHLEKIQTEADLFLRMASLSLGLCQPAFYQYLVT